MSGKIFINGIYKESFNTNPDIWSIPASLNIGPTLDSKTYFRFFRFWNVYIKHYAA